MLTIAAIGLTACGDDNDSSGSGEANAEYAEFCTNELSLEAAVASEDPAAIDTAFADLSASTPESSQELVEATIAEAKKFLTPDSNGPTDEFNVLYAQLVGVVKDNCGFGNFDVTTKDYEFASVSPASVGPVVVTLTNEGTEYHEVSIFRKNDGVDMAPKDILALGEEESMSKVTRVNGAWAPPGEQGFTVTELPAGDYFIACFVSQGSTKEAYDAMMAGGPEPDGEPHFMLGMIHEFEVK